MNPLTEPAYIPFWHGFDPIRFWIAPEMRRFEGEIRYAMEVFTREKMPHGGPLRLRFSEIFQPRQVRCIDFRMEPLVGILGLGMYPPPLNEEPASGDVTLNALVPWDDPECRSLVLPVLIHEIAAHSLGLSHLYLPESVRFPRVSAGKINLSRLDREALLTMYGV